MERENSEREEVAHYGTIRKDHIVESRITFDRYKITLLTLDGISHEPGSKQFDEFLVLTPRCVRIVGEYGDGMEVAVP